MALFSWIRARLTGAPESLSEPMKVIVDFELCQSHGRCMQAAPEVVEVRDDGFLDILSETPPENLRKKVETAMRECPTGAIKLEG